MSQDYHDDYPVKGDKDYVPFITVRTLIIIHVALLIAVALWSWLDWSLPQ
ncbi:hypothetical protein [Acetobacter ascendens]|uniref:Uncharacterized protein n=1 Tax=Acetobacter ascendens TaxID=481146 RepID=A0A1Y0V465_9PROT|nr:hypothetical protein [Acetobacter ascendens]ARW10699.1 hypothetical protein S101447_01628 [Acetobacter ascendens]GCD75837.1 hypothetical protein NBRC3299_2129 [Acetobacter pasteurianus NBRC 3299]